MNELIAETAVPVDLSEGQITLRLCRDGSIGIPDDNVMGAWCKHHGKKLVIGLDAREWTDGLPTAPGYYWMLDKYDDDGAEIVYIHEYEKPDGPKLFVADSRNAGTSSPLSNHDRERYKWFGPIWPPVQP